jgi:glycosyltransferase involved in cell wall biosynthesis
MSTNLRVALVTETFAPEINGVAMTLGHLVRGLVKRGHAVQLVRPRQSKGDGAQTLQGVTEVLAMGIPIPNYGGLRFGLPMRTTLGRLWRLDRPDVVHIATEGPLGWSALSAARKLKLPITSSFHTNFQSYSGHYGLAMLKTPIEAYLRKVHNHTRATLVPTRALATQLTARGFHNVRLMSRGVATDLFHPSKRSAALRANWGANERDVVVCHVGRLAKEKNIELVLTSFSAIKSRCPQAKLLLVGDGPLREQIQRDCPEAIFAGTQTGEALAQHYASADLFLFPSLTDTFGNVIPEALASGLCVVSFNQAAAAELIQDGYNGRTVFPGDVQRFVQAASALAVDTAVRTGMRQAAPHTVSHLAWSEVEEGFIRTLCETIAQHSASLRQSAPAGAVIPV